MHCSLELISLKNVWRILNNASFLFIKGDVAEYLMEIVIRIAYLVTGIHCMINNENMMAYMKRKLTNIIRN